MSPRRMQVTEVWREAWRDIASGADEDPAAEAARAHLSTSLTALREARAALDAQA